MPCSVHIDVTILYKGEKINGFFLFFYGEKNDLKLANVSLSDI